MQGCPQSLLVFEACSKSPVVPMGPSMGMEVFLLDRDLKLPLFCPRDMEFSKAPELAAGRGHHMPFPRLPAATLALSVSLPASLTVKTKVPPGRAAWLHWSGARLRRKRN